MAKNKSTFKLSDFKAAIKANGVARNTRFEVTVHPPTAILDSFDANEISIRCNSASLPPMNIKTKDYIVGQGQVRKMPIGYDQGGTSQFTFYNDARSRVYTDLLQWVKSVMAYSGENQYELNYYSTFTGQIKVKQLDETDTVHVQYTLYEAYPVALEAVNLDSADQNTPQLVKVTFAYRYAMATENQQDLASWESTTKVVGYGARDIAAYDNTANIDRSMFPVAQRVKGNDIPFTERYNQTYQMCTAANVMGNGVYQQQTTLWPQNRTAINGALGSGNTNILSSIWDGAKSIYNSISQKATEFFSSTATVNKEYSNIAPALAPSDPLHNEMSMLKSTYTTVANNQSSMKAEFANLDSIVKDAIGSANSVTFTVE